MKTWNLFALLVFCMTLFSATLAFSTDMTTLPAEKVQGAVSYVSGGIGHDEAVTMKKAASRYPLSLEFVHNSKPKGEYLSDVEVTIKDSKGNTVLHTVSDGPFLLANVARGSYTVWANADGKAKQQHVSVGKNTHTHLIFTW